ncbi:deoxyribodipyrimidine photo-lyase [Nocardioides sp. SR21]|uniref:cryptochrome/photolyase family protein n=1 Tax=Nocardioides sp. SR21 TaxID=2919501 RepID=UPI001FAA5E76|nr:deoxyribodipyrimidine photo-lyase [Nocardioides sp. SR21]
MTSILWLRRDLRLDDHPALLAAAEDGPVVPVFVREPRLGRSERLDASLEAFRGATDGALVIRTGDPIDVIPDLVDEVGARSVHVTEEFTPHARRRDAVVAELVTLVASGTPYAVRPGTLLTGAGTPYQVFTPFARAWRDQPVEPPLPRPDSVRWKTAAGEELARRRLRAFRDEGYAEGRDRPDRDDTSRLSEHLRHGEIHPRTVLANVTDPTFVTELIWREFYADVLWNRPDTAWADLRSLDMPYDEDGELVDAWREGRTGYPFVDAGMRQLLASGWMHNRLRMVTASFLVKDLHVRWQVGARFFLKHLADGDLASNNHGWQWVAGTGTDAAPYFRIFNPVRQGLQFDPDGAYVRRWVPELAHLPGKAAHEPWRHEDGYAGSYPERIVDHDEERREALDRYQRASPRTGRPG